MVAGTTGAGIGVAVIDTGINAADGSSRVLRQMKFNAAQKNVADGHGHGTHVAGNSWYASDASVQGKYIGIAPGAHLLDLRASSDEGNSMVSDVVEALDWAVANRDLYNIRVLNLSMITNTSGARKASILAAAVERAWFAGIFVVVASGNIGPNTIQYAPANDPFPIVVGAGDTKRTLNRADDGIATWSSYGKNAKNTDRPDVVAPGRWIPSVLSANNAKLKREYGGRVMDPGYIWMSGTSMAASVVSGLAALVLQAHPELTNDQLKWLMVNTATQLPGVTGSGAGMVNYDAIMNYEGQIGFANDGYALPDYLAGPEGSFNYSTSSWSTSSWSTYSTQSTIAQNVDDEVAAETDRTTVETVVNADAAFEGDEVVPEMTESVGDTLLAVSAVE